MIDLDGHVLKKLGDGLMAHFGYPMAQENDAETVVRSIAFARPSRSAGPVANGAFGHVA